MPKYTEAGVIYDLVIIDESEQVFAHLLSETISQRAGIESCFDALKLHIENAKAVFALDADLGLVTTHALRTMRLQDWKSRCGIIYNAPVVPDQKRIIHLHKSRNYLERQVIEAVKRGERCFVVSNSKKFIDAAHRMILNECGNGIVMRVVTRDNSRDPATVEFLKNIKTEYLVIQVLLGTPSIGTGIDVTFPNGECRVDRVFGFFFPFVNTHTDIDQQLSRVRNPGAVDVWISQVTSNFTCNIDVIKDDLARGYVVPRAVTGRRPDGMIDYNREDPLLMICAHVTALRRASMNRLIELFCALREANGWSIEWIFNNAPTGPHASAQKMLGAERKEMLRNARPVGDAEYIELDEKVSKGAALTNDERIRHERSHFERTVGVPLDDGLIEINVDGKLLKKVENLAGVEAVLCSDHPNGLVDTLLARAAPRHGRLQSMKPERLIAVLLRSAGVTNVTGFNRDRLVTVDTLSDFVAICADNQTVIEEVLGEPLRGDLDVNPVRQLGLFLKRIGLRIVRVKTEKVAGRKIRYYAVPVDLLDMMLPLARSTLVFGRVPHAGGEASTRTAHALRRSIAAILGAGGVLPGTRQQASARLSTTDFPAARLSRVSH